MDMTYVGGRSFSSVTSGERTEDGKWRVVVTMSETLSYPNGTVREEQVESSHIDTDFNEAHKTAMKNVLQQLQDLVYSRGFDSLIEGLDYERNLNDSTAKIDEAPKSE